MYMYIHILVKFILFSHDFTANDKLKKGIVLKNSEIASDHVHSEPIHNNYTGEGHYEVYWLLTMIHSFDI